MNDPVQKTWNDTAAGDLVSPDGQQWFRMVDRVGANVTIVGPLTPPDMSNGPAVPPFAVDPAGPVWIISTTPATPAQPAAPSPQPTSNGAVSNDELAQGMVTLAKRIKCLEDVIGAMGSAYASSQVTKS